MKKIILTIPFTMKKLVIIPIDFEIKSFQEVLE